MTKGRILCVTSNYPRWKGDSTTPFVLNLAQDLKKLGWHIDVLAPHAPGALLRETFRGVDVERFRYLWPTTLETVCYQGGALINLRKDKMNNLKLPALIVSEWFSIFKRLIKRKYDILHSHWILPQGFTGLLASRLLGIPHVTTVHGGDIFGLRGILLKYFKRFVLTYADAVTVNSGATWNAVTEIAPRLSHLYRIPMGVSVKNKAGISAETEQIRSRYRRGDGPLLVFVGRVVEEKGVEDLIRAINFLKSSLPDVSALIVGEGQDRPALERITAEMSLNDRITFTGWVDPEMIGTYLEAADVFVGPSRRSNDGWVEAQGLTFIEAMVAKIPVTPTGGIVDVVCHEETGMLVNEQSPEEIAAAVEKLFFDPALAEKSRDKGHKLVMNGYSRESSAKAFSNLFERVIKADR